MKRAVLLAAVSVLASAPLQALAGKPQPKVQQSAQGLGMAKFVSGDFQGALSLFNEALAEARGGGETARVHLLRGQCFVALSDEANARRAFELALDQDPEIQLDPNQVSPETIELLTRVRSGLHGELVLLGQNYFVER